MDFLVEDAELVADPVTDGRDLQGGQGIHVTGGQAAQTAVAEARLFLLFQQVVQAQFLQGVSHLAGDPKVDQAVAQMGPGQVLRREVADEFGVLLQVGLGRIDPTVHQVVANGVCERGIHVMRRGDREKLALNAA